MIRATFKSVLSTFCTSDNFNYSALRYVRSIVRHETGPKLLKGKMKTLTKYDDTPQIESYQDLINHIKETQLGDELEVEKSFTQEDSFGTPIEQCERYFDLHTSEEKTLKSKVKKEIIKRKYFKFDKETHLLTCAAKDQIRYLYKTNPTEWNCKALAECFPISEEGVKKLLKCNFTQKYPEKIKAHDEEVAKRWKDLKSGKFNESITPLTRKLFKEGKLVDDYFSGNPNLPTTPPKKKVIELDKPKETGEFSAIVQTYVDYEKQKLLESDTENSSESQLTLRGNNKIEYNPKTYGKEMNKFKYAMDEFDNETAEIYFSRKKHRLDDTDLPLSQFKEILKEEIKSQSEREYKEISEDTVKDSSKKPYDPENCFIKIQKFNKEKVHAMYDTDKKVKRIYKYDENIGYQYPLGKNIKGHIHLSPQLHKNGKLFKVGKNVYNDDGEFLYKVPS